MRVGPKRSAVIAPTAVSDVEVEVVDGDVRPRAPDVEAPLPSGADIAHRRSPLANVAVTNVVGVRAIDAGSRALAKRLDDIERMTRDGVHVRCVFDLDNTIFDTRHRTLFCAQEFSREHPEAAAWFTGAGVDAMKVDGRETAIALGAPNDVVEEFANFWQREFWNPANLVHDEPIKAMVDLVNECKNRGADVCFLTGRCDHFVHPQAPERGDESFRAATHEQLMRAGIDVDDDALALKPMLGVWTPQYKQGQLQAWEQDSEIGLFLTEGRRDLDFLQAQIPALACFRLDCSFEDSGPACEKIPALRREF